MRIVFWAAFWTLVLDQVTKFLVVNVLNLRQRDEIDVLPPFFNLRMAWNEGINFGLLSANPNITRWVLIAVALSISLGVLIWVWREQPRRIGLIAAGLLVGGAIGNVVDRIVYGAVADFINMSCCGIENPYAFNIADVAIFAGALALVLVPAEKKGA